MRRVLGKLGLLMCLAIVLAILAFNIDGQRRGDFQHTTAAHKKITCAQCHKVPTGNWVSARQYPDVADFPGHASCISCHRRDFFSGNRPAICAGCHTNPGPRGAARFAFPVRSRPTEFRTIFPHDVHQNLIASLHNTHETRDIGSEFIRASFRPADDPIEFNNCAVCHKTPTTLPRTADRKITFAEPLVEAATDPFKPTAAFFKDNPSSHASCFNCHYQNVKPTRTDCAGCHTLTAPSPRTWVAARYSLKFDHAYKDHANKDCTVCHVRIVQNSNLATLVNADVPFMTCSTSSCHGSHIDDETAKREASITAGGAVFQCTYCHTPSIGRFPIPSSHTAR